MNKRQAYRVLVFLVCALVFTKCSKEGEQEVQIERGTVTDREGKVYATVKIGDQWWMAENLATTTFSDGTTLERVEEDAADEVWMLNTAPKYTVLNNGRAGLLYSSQVIQSDKRIAPDGWHIATDEDWKKLENYIGMEWKQANNTGWRGTDEAVELTSKYSRGWPAGIVLFGLDKYGFNALPTGCRTTQGFVNISSSMGFWWSPSGDDLYYRYIDAGEERIFRQTMPSNYALAIRCVKN